jgi:hypothetical protein
MPGPGRAAAAARPAAPGGPWPPARRRPRLATECVWGSVSRYTTGTVRPRPRHCQATPAARPVTVTVTFTVTSGPARVTVRVTGSHHDHGDSGPMIGSECRPVGSPGLAPAALQVTVTVTVSVTPWPGVIRVTTLMIDSESKSLAF